MTLRAYFYSRRGRNLAALTAAAVAALGLAFVAITHRTAVMAPKYEENLFLPGFAEAVNAGEVTHIRIQSAKNNFEIAFLPTKGWVLPRSGNYPASFTIVKQTLASLAGLETIEPKTNNPDLYSYVGLDTPPKGHGVALTITNDKGKVLTALVLGKSEQRGDDVMIFVRKSGAKQSWLVKSPGEIKISPVDWMDKAIIALAPDRVASVSVEPPSGPGYTVKRSSPTEENFVITPLPKGRELVYPGSANSVASALSDFSFDDIARSTDFDFASGAKMVVHSFDGLVVSLSVVTNSGANWIRIFAESEPGKSAAAKEALAINARTVGWAFKLPTYKASLFAQPLETLLKPKS
jgi:hypothetical protein